MSRTKKEQIEWIIDGVEKDWERLPRRKIIPHIEHGLGLTKDKAEEYLDLALKDLGYGECWICRRTPKQIEENFPNEDEYNTYYNWEEYGYHVCPVCSQYIDFKIYSFLKDIIQKLPLKLDEILDACGGLKSAREGGVSNSNLYV